MTDLQHTFHLDETLYQGRPEDSTGRLPKEIRTYDLLDQLGIEYMRADHSPCPTIEACKGVDSLLGIEVCKNLLLCNSQKTDFYLLLLPGYKKFRTAVLSKQIGSARLSFAESEYMEEFLDITPGSLSVLGLMNDKNHRVRLLLDKDVISSEFFGCHPCINTSSLKIKPQDLLNVFLPAIGCEYTLVDLSQSQD